MRTRILLLLVFAFLLPSACGLSEAAEQMVFLPRGTWSLEDEGWCFVTQEQTPLTDAQLQSAAAFGVTADGTMLPEGTRLSEAQIDALYPGADAYFAHTEAVSPEPTSWPTDDTPAELKMFELDGEWFYGADDTLFYTHAETGATYTMDQVFEALCGKPSAASKVIYLTIDDAPTQYTMDLLAVLDQLNIKATFFVVGAYVKNRPVFLRAIHENGHAIANHSYSHNESVLTASADSCLRDFQRCEQAVSNALGFTLPMPILRVPYGAGTLPVAYREHLQESGYLWIDWNALNGDTEDAVTSDELSLERAFSTAGRYDGSIVLLVHDGKKRTIRTLPELVRHFKEQGYEFRVLTDDIERIPGVRMGFPK